MYILQHLQSFNIDSSIAHHKYAFIDIVMILMPLIAFVITITQVIVANIAILMGVVISPNVYHHSVMTM